MYIYIYTYMYTYTCIYTHPCINMCAAHVRFEIKSEYSAASTTPYIPACTIASNRNRCRWRNRSLYPVIIVFLFFYHGTKFCLFSWVSTPAPHVSFKSVSVTIWAPKIHGNTLQIFCAFTKTSISVRFFTIGSPSQRLAKKLKKRELYALSVRIFGEFTQCCLCWRTRFVPILFVMFCTTKDVLSDVFHHKKKGSSQYRHKCKRQLMYFVFVLVCCM